MIRVGVSADYPPFEYYDNKFQLDGFDIALMKALGEELGVKVEFNDFAFEGLGSALQLDQIDIAISAISVTPEREELVSFSDIYYIGQDAVLVSATSDLSEIDTPEEVAPLRVGVQAGTVYENYVQTSLVDTGILPEENMHVYTDISQATRDLKRGLIDAVLLDRQPAETFRPMAASRSSVTASMSSATPLPCRRARRRCAGPSTRRWTPSRPTAWCRTLPRNI